jgi:heme/copper-type cytochrome/quinol oxidase subunit 2
MIKNIKNLMEKKSLKNAQFTVNALICSIILTFLAVIISGCSSEEAAIAGMGSIFTGLAGVYICFIVIAWLAGIFFFVIWIITLVDCARRKNEDFPNPGENTKLIWILIIVFAGGIGALIYFFMVMKNTSAGKPKQLKE